MQIPGVTYEKDLEDSKEGEESEKTNYGPMFYPNTCGEKLDEEDPFHVAGATNDKIKNPTGHWPWMASFGVMRKDFTWEHKCGATLITHQHFITAAHCLQHG